MFKILNSVSYVAFAAADKAKGPAPKTEEAKTDTEAKTDDGGKSLSVGAQLGVLTVGGKTFKAKQVTRTVLKQRDGEAIFVKITGKVYQGEELKGQTKDGKAKMDPARLAEVINLKTNSLNVIIVNTVLEGELDRLYPNGGYVGLSFSIIMMPAEEGKRYKSFEIFELDETDAA